MSSLAPDMPEAALAVSHLSHSFGARAVLRDVSFTVHRGDFTVLLGLNGAGKTTLFALITRLYHSRSGDISVLGHDMKRDPLSALARLGVVFQQQTLDLDLTVRQNLRYQASLHGMTRANADPRITEELSRVGLLERLDDRVRNLSGGQRRRVELARSLLHAPSLLLLDEPTVGLDIESRRFLRAHVSQLCQTTGLGVLWATHLIDEVVPEARVIVLHRGQVLAEGPRASIAAAQQGDIGAAFAALTQDQAA